MTEHRHNHQVRRGASAAFAERLIREIAEGEIKLRRRGRGRYELDFNSNIVVIRPRLWMLAIARATLHDRGYNGRIVKKRLYFRPPLRARVKLALVVARQARRDRVAKRRDEIARREDHLQKLLAGSSSRW